MRTNNILLIVEGEKDEPEFFKKLGSIFLNHKTNFQFYKYKSNIYSLFNKIKELDEFTSTPAALRDLSINEEEKKFLKLKFYSIYLIFDYDIQEPAYSDKVIKELVDFFYDETNEIGKLYINYPMMDSFRDHSNFNLDSFIDKKIKIEGLTSDSYKKHISLYGYNKKIDQFTKRHFCKFAKMNLLKVNNIMFKKKRIPDYETYKRYFTQAQILDLQIEQKNKTNELYALNTCSFFILDYFGSKILNEINKN